jgi:hypothetical protein
MSGLEDRCRRLPKPQQRAGLVPGTPGLASLLQRAEALHDRRLTLAEDTTRLGMAIRDQLLTAYGPAILGARYDPATHTLGIDASLPAPVPIARLARIAERFGCDANYSTFSTLFRAGTRDTAATCHMLGDERRPPLRYKLKVELGYALREELLHALLQDYLGLKPAGGQAGAP